MSTEDCEDVGELASCGTPLVGKLRPSSGIVKKKRGEHVARQVRSAPVSLAEDSGVHTWGSQNLLLTSRPVTLDVSECRKSHQEKCACSFFSSSSTYV